MNFNFFIFENYSQFIWPAFFFTFIICISLFLTTKSKLNKLEKKYIKYDEKFHTKPVEILKRRKLEKKVFI